MTAEPGLPHQLLEYVNRPPGYEHLLKARDQLFPSGENVLHRDWDLCVVLDACRADLLEEAISDGWRPPQSFTYETTRSLESATQPWIERTVAVDPDAVEPVTYVCSNPFSVEARDAAVVETLDEVWQYGWDEQLRTVPPSVVTDRAVHHCRQSDERVLAHYVQPHMPALRRGEDGSVERRFEPYGGPEHSDADTWLAAAGAPGSLWQRFAHEWDSPSDDLGGFFDDLRFGDLDHETAWRAYRESLDVVLEEVETLLRAVDAESVLLTADHGNAFGEWGVYAHPYHMPLSVLREVPVVETTASAEIDYEPAARDAEQAATSGGATAAERADDEAREERLAALGYV